MDSLPLGFGMALEQNVEAMQCFSALPRQKQKEIIDHTSQIESKKEMQAYVQSLTNKIWQSYLEPHGQW